MDPTTVVSWNQETHTTYSGLVLSPLWYEFGPP